MYGFVIWELRRSSRRLHTQRELSSQQAKDTHRRIRKSCLIMCCYPIAYIALTLPLAVSRMYEVNGTKSSLSYRIFCGCFLVSSGKLSFHALIDPTLTRLLGWVDALLYVLTRASFLKSQGHCRDHEDGDEDRRRSMIPPAPTLKNPPRVLHSPAPSSNRASPVGAPMRMDSISSWKSDTKSLSHSRPEEPLSTFDHEVLLSTRTLTLNAKVTPIREAH